MNNLRENRGAISIIVVSTILFFAIILTGTYLLNTTVRKAQIKSQIQLRDEYGELINDSAAQNTIKSNYADFIQRKYSVLNATYDTPNSSSNPYYTYLVKESGYYLIECRGGNSTAGYGGTTQGKIYLEDGTTLYFVVGGPGETKTGRI